MSNGQVGISIRSLILNPAGDPLRKVMKGSGYSGDEIYTLTFMRRRSNELSTGGGGGFRIVFDTD
jgi:hypothetical protein